MIGLKLSMGLLACMLFSLAIICASDLEQSIAILIK